MEELSCMVGALWLSPKLCEAEDLLWMIESLLLAVETGRTAILSVEVFAAELFVLLNLEELGCSVCLAVGSNADQLPMLDWENAEGASGVEGVICRNRRRSIFLGVVLRSCERFLELFINMAAFISLKSGRLANSGDRTVRNAVHHQGTVSVRLLGEVENRAKEGENADDKRDLSSAPCKGGICKRVLEYSDIFVEKALMVLIKDLIDKKEGLLIGRQEESETLRTSIDSVVSDGERTDLRLTEAPSVQEELMDLLLSSEMETGRSSEVRRDTFVMDTSVLQRSLDKALAEKVSDFIMDLGSDQTLSENISEHTRVEWLSFYLSGRISKVVCDYLNDSQFNVLPKESIRGNAMVWKTVTETLAQRVAEDFFQWMSRYLTSHIERNGIFGEDFFSQQSLAREAMLGINCREVFRHISKDQLMKIICCYVNLAHCKVTEQSDRDSDEFRRNIFMNETEDFRCRSDTYASRTKTGQGNSRKDAPGIISSGGSVRSGLRELVLDQCVDKILNDLATDTAMWVNTLL